MTNLFGKVQTIAFSHVQISAWTVQAAKVFFQHKIQNKFIYASIDQKKKTSIYKTNIFYLQND